MPSNTAQGPTAIRTAGTADYAEIAEACNGGQRLAFAFRAKIVLRAADDDSPTNLQIATELGCARDTAATWRRRFAAEGLPGLQDAPRSGRPRSFPPSDRVDVTSIATSQPADYDCHATRWSLDDLARTILNQKHAEAMSRSTIWRILQEGDLKPHKSYRRALAA